ncbi:L,D-transpeptidase [Streptomyces sp. NPDC048623]|uniref:L,D-transpeptidase n=1 Tax=Streptomyces sp. NPDC048623 TaxID=3155761 RepID=UPI00343C80FD
MARSSSGFVAALTAAAVAVVGFLAYQASASAPSPAELAAKPRTPSSAPSAEATGKPKQPVRDPLALPADSGRGERVVYGLKDRRVWLVDAKNQVTHTFSVMPSTVSPAPGAYAVTSRSGSVRGSDGVQIEHVVRFTTTQDVAIGFSAAVDGSTPDPDPTKKTGGIRMKRADGDALWLFATIGAKVVVVA